MEIITEFIEIETRGFCDIIDITGKVQQVINTKNFSEGMALVCVIGSTAGITTVEFEPGLVKTDLPELFNKLSPYGVPYSHDNTWGDDNGAAHLRASLLGGSLTIPFTKGKLILGTWQQVVFIDFDTKPRKRKVTVQIHGN